MPIVAYDKVTVAGAKSHQAEEGFRSRRFPDCPDMVTVFAEIVRPARPVMVADVPPDKEKSPVVVMSSPLSDNPPDDWAKLLHVRGLASISNVPDPE